MPKIRNDRPLTIERLKEVLRYDPSTGHFFWNVALSPRGVAGARAGMVRRCRYRFIIIDYEQYKANRLAWFYVHGEWPTAVLDHINTVKDDDRIENLRPATLSQNAHNVGLTNRNKSGFKGVHRATKNRWQASITFQGRFIYLGLHPTKEGAAAAYADAAAQYHGEFARLA